MIFVEFLCCRCLSLCQYTFLVLFLWLPPPLVLFVSLFCSVLVVGSSFSFQLESCLFNERKRKKKCGFGWAGGEDLVGVEEGKP